MPNKIFKKIEEWDLKASAEEIEDATNKIYFKEIFDRIKFMADHRYKEYHPTWSSAYPDFIIRFRDWLFDNIDDDEDRKILFRMVPEIFFIGGNEFRSLYLSAFNDIIIRWLIDLLDLKFDEPTIKEKIDDAVKRTWFCPITDSMIISEFYHINGIYCLGDGYRPDWRTLGKFGEIDKINEYMTSNRLARIVLLEDFIGCGSQMKDAVKFIGQNFSAIESLIVPLVICPEGVKLGKTLENRYSNISFTPVLSIPEMAFVKSSPVADEPTTFALIRKLVKKVHPIVRGTTGNDTTYGPFGYPQNNGTGALVVMNSNCPDNTLPIIRYKSNLWNYPLFPRLNREQ